MGFIWAPAFAGETEWGGVRQSSNTLSAAYFGL